MMSEDEKTVEKIVRKRSLRASGESSSVVTIPPICLELTEFETGEDVEIEAEIGGDEITLRPVTDDQKKSTKK